jgi:hypothetical protein
MTVAYVVSSHRNPRQVLRLVSALREGPETEVMVRHDQRRTSLSRGQVEDRGGHMLEDGIDVRWGEFSYLRVLVGAFDWALEHLEPDWIVVLSGQDYPLRPPAEIEARLGATPADAFLTAAWELPTDHRPEPPAEEFFLRYAYRHFKVPGWVPALPRALRSLLYTREMPAGLGKRLGLRRARLPFGPARRCFVSSDWMTLSAQAARVVIETAGRDSALMRYYRGSLIPSESFFATVLLNHPELEIALEDRRLISFAAPGVPHPDVFTSADLGRLVDSDMDFARKFDEEVDAEVLDALDEHRRSLSASS